MKLTDWAWKNDEGRQSLDCKISIETDGTYAIENHEGEKESFSSLEDLTSALGQAVSQRSNRS